MIGIEYEDASFGNESFVGIPFLYLLRDIAQFDASREAAVERIRAANRTCNLMVGVADGASGTFAGIQYSASVANVMESASQQMPVNASWHPQIPDVLYWCMDWLW